MRSAVLLGLMFSFSLAQTAQDAGNGSIEGVVVDGASGQPVEGALLTLQPAGTGFRVFGAQSISPFQTGPDGKFAFGSLKAGAYGLEIGVNGYVRQNYGQKIFPAGYGGVAGEGTTITLAAGEAMKSLSIRLMPTATITGRIRETDTKQPVVGVPIQLMRYIYQPDGQRTLQQMGSARTNDRGEYRLYFVTPGRYYVKAGGTITTVGTRPSSENEIGGTYPAVFYPAAATVSDATIVDVKPGAEIGATDMLLATRQDLYRIRGRVLDSATGQPPPSVSISLYRRSGARWETDGTTPSNYRSADGSFELRNLTSGSYLIRVEARSTPQRFLQLLPSTSGLARVVTVAYQGLPSPIRPPDVRGYATKVVPVTIAGADVDNLAVPVAPGISLTGSVSVDRRPLSATEANALRVYFTSPDGLLRANSAVTVSNGEATIQLNDVAPGEYRASMSLPRGFYMKEARFAGVDAMSSTFQVSDRETAGLTFVLSPNVARVEGTVANDKLESVADALVVLVPERDRDRVELFQNTATDRAGHFVFPNVPPGNYKVFSWDVLDPYSYFDPEVLRRVEQRGRAVQLQESSTTSLSLTAIPEN